MELKITGLMKRHLLVNVAIFGLGKMACGPRTQIRESKGLLGSCQLLGDGALRHIKTIQHHATLRPHDIWKKKKITIFLFLTLLFASLILQISYKIPAGNFTGYLMFLLVSSFYSYICIFNQLHVYTFNNINIQLNIGRLDKMMS